MSTRFTHLDYAKGIGIFLVVLGHHSSIFTSYIYSFHMPLFFILAGVFHSKITEFTPFIKRKAQALLIPYFSFSIILFAFWSILGKKVGTSSISNTPVKLGFNGIFIANDIKNISSMEWGTPLWFLPCLFLVSVIFFFIQKFNLKKIFIFNLLLVITSIYVNSLINIKLPWSILTSFMALPFYSFGYVFRNSLSNIKNNNILIFCFLFFGLNIISYFLNGSTDMFNNRYNNYLIFYVGAIFGSLFIIYFSFFIQKFNLKWLSFLGINSLIILAFHSRALTFVKGVIFLLKFTFLENSFLAILYSIIQIIICVPLILIINIYFPFFLGKFNSITLLRK